MATETTRPTYTSQNYDAINDYIGHVADRHRARSAQWKSNTFATYAKWSASVVVAGGLAAFLVLFGLSLYKQKPEPLIVRPVVIDRDVTINIPPGMTMPKATTVVERERGEARRRSEEIGGRTSPTPETGVSGVLTQRKTVVNYVIFKEISFGRGGIDIVTVGMRYKDSSAEHPYRQWCYIGNKNISGTITRVELAEKNGKTRKDYRMTSGKAREIHTTVIELQAAQRLCSFE